MVLDIGDHVSIGAAIGVALGFLRVVERLIERTLNGKNGNGKVVVVKLDPEASRQIVDTHGMVTKIEDVVSERDENGAPLVYAPRAILGRIEGKLDRLASGDKR